MSGIESGRRNPTLDVLARIAGALEVPLSDLFSLVTLEMGAQALSISDRRRG